MSEEMFEDGFINLQSIDTSYTAIKLMTDEYKEKIPQLVFKVMDVRQLN